MSQPTFEAYFDILYQSNYCYYSLDSYSISQNILLNLISFNSLNLDFQIDFLIEAKVHYIYDLKLL
jgi:hypothetical protein